MEAGITEGQTMGKPVLEALQAVVGAENAAAGPEEGSRFLRPGAKTPEWIRVSPATTEQVQAIVNLAREMKVGIVTCTNSPERDPQDRAGRGTPSRARPV